MSRINCHSAFKHYEMFHSGHCGGGYNSVSNTVFNINCGGHGGFWNGFGLGLGNALGGFFGGFGGGMGFGFPTFGNFGGWGNFGNWGNRTNNLNNTRNTETVKEVVKNDPDCAKIADITGKIKNLGENPTKETLSGIIDEIDDALDNLDDNNKRAQKRTLENLKEQLQTKLTNLNSQPTAVVRQTPELATLAANPDAAKVTGLGTENTNPAGTTAGAANQGKITVNGKTIDPNAVTLDDIKNIKPAELDAITKNQATQILKNLGYITGDGNDAVGHLSNVYGVLKLLEKSGVTVEVENRTASADQWIKGPLSNVQQAADGKLSYDVDCANIGAFGAKYTFQAQDTTNTKYKVASTNTGVSVDNTIEVEYQGEQKPLINKSGKELVKKAKA